MRALPLASLLLSLALLPGCMGSRPYQGADFSVVARGVASEVETIRGQHLEELVRVEEVGRAEIEGFVRERLDHAYSRDRLEREAVAFARIGLYEEVDDPVGRFRGTLMAVVIGFYDPVRDRLGLDQQGLARGHLETGMARELILAHELTHALQDQRRDLYRFLADALDEGSDRHLATLAVVEGEAQAVMYGYLLAGSGKGIEDVEGDLGSAILVGLDPLKGGRKGRRANPLEGRAVLFPYYVGASFIQRVYERGGWRAVDELFENRPALSTEQVLHPEKFVDTVDYPQELQLPDAGITGQAGWPTLLEDTVGEFSIRSLLERFVGGDEAIVASIGWDGDALRVCRNEAGEVAYVWRLTWDSPEDAREFFSAYQRSVPLRLPAADPLASPGASEEQSGSWQTSEGLLTIDCRARDVTIVSGFPRELSDALVVAARTASRRYHPADLDRGHEDARTSKAAQDRALAGLSSASSPADGVRDSVVSGNTLRDREYGFRISRPSSQRWHFVRNPTGSMRRARLQRLDDLDPDKLLPSRYANVEVVPLRLPLDLDQIARQTERQLAFTVGSYRKLAVHRVEFSGRPAVEFLYRGTIGESAMRFRQVTLLSGGHQFILTAASPVTHFEEDHEDFARILESFELE